MDLSSSSSIFTAQSDGIVQLGLELILIIFTDFDEFNYPMQE